MRSDAYRTSYARALLKQASSGFNARSLDADDFALIERIKTTRTAISADDLGHAYQRPLMTHYSCAHYISYASEQDALEAFAFERAYRSVPAKQRFFDQQENAQMRERQASKHKRGASRKLSKSTRDRVSIKQQRFAQPREAREQREHDREEIANPQAFFAVGDAAAENERMQHALLQARRRVAFERARKYRSFEMQELERINREHSA